MNPASTPLPPMADLRSAMRGVASTVSVLTCATAAGRYGMTATSLTSVCLEPPTVLVCINRSAALHRPLEQARRFCVQVLQADQVAVAQAFAGGLQGDARFGVGQWADWDGLPVLAGALVQLHCAVVSMLEQGTHSVVLGQVLGVRLAPAGLPLVHHNGGYLRQHDLAPA